MPTTRPRHMITETDEIAAALEDARERWPDERPAGLLRRLIGEGHEVIQAQRSEEIQRRLEALERVKGSAPEGVYPPGYLKRLREEWD